MATDAFESFRRSIQEDGAKARFRRDYAIRALVRLSGPERDRALELLFARLETKGDPRVPRALGHLGDRRAIPELGKALQTHPLRSKLHAEIALALWRIAGDPRAVHLLVEILLHGRSWSARNVAACELHAFDREEVVPALLRALDDPDRLVRSNVVRSLRKKLDLPFPDRGSPLHDVLSTLRRGDAPARKEARTELRRYLDGRDRGTDLTSWHEAPG